MKKQLLTLAISVFAFSSFAKIRIVDDAPINGKNYSSLQAAIDDSAPGDTVYIKENFNQNGGKTYGNIIIDKKIVLIGACAYNSSYKFSYVNTITFKGYSCDDSEIHGLHVSMIYIGTNKCKNLVFKNNRMGINNSVDGEFSNFKFINNVIHGCEFYPRFPEGNVYLNDFLFSNNIMNNIQIVTPNWNYDKTFNANITVANNIIGGNFAGRHCLLENNIINMIPQYTKHFYDCILHNNGIFNDVISDENIIAGNNFKDIIFRDPLQTSEYFDKYSIYNTAGTDGTAIGIKGGRYPWNSIENNNKNVDAIYPVSLPKVGEVNINSGSLPTNGTLNVNIKAKSIK
jgi:hypothetical protein